MKVVCDSPRSREKSEDSSLFRGDAGMSRPEPPKVALVCDWLTHVGGAEQVLRAFHELYPDAPIYTSQYREQGIDWFKDAEVKTGWLNFFPAKLRRILGPLRQLYFNHLDLSTYDIVISVTGAEAKSVKTKNDKKGTKATHFCYCHVPTQYYWQFYDRYVKDPGFGALNPIVKTLFKLFVKPLRNADYQAAQRPDHFITISTYAKNLIKKHYNRNATIIHPPVAVENFSKVKRSASSSTYYINFSRQVGWKRLDLAVKACLDTGQKLLLIGDGPEHEQLVRLAEGSPNIKFLPAQNQSKLQHYLREAKAFIFPSLEPFGIAPVEALAAGVPVIAYQEGGAKDYLTKDNGVTFKKQTASSLAEAIRTFENRGPSKRFPVKKVKNSAKNFSQTNFKKQMKGFINEKTKKAH